MKFKYRASWIATIEKYPYVSETSKKITIGHDTHLGKNVSYSKETDDNKFCDTFEEAKEFLVKKHERKIGELESALLFAKENLERAKNLRECDVEDLCK